MCHSLLCGLMACEVGVRHPVVGPDGRLVMVYEAVSLQHLLSLLATTAVSSPC